MASGLLKRLLALVVLAAYPAPAAAQAPRPRAANLFLGVHGLGIGVEIPVADRAQLAFRGQGIIAERTILAAGVRLDLVPGDRAALYAAGLLGRVGCGAGLFEPSCDIDAQFGAAPIGGFEISVSRGNRVLLGGEAGYWFTAPGESPSLQHAVFEFVVRIREH